MSKQSYERMRWLSYFAALFALVLITIVTPNEPPNKPAAMRMRFPKQYLLLGTLLTIFVAAFTGLVVVASRRAAAIRADRLTTIVAEIERGNYFAWVQARSWRDQLAEPERAKVLIACRQYAQINKTLHWKDDTWPPESASALRLRLRELASYVGFRSYALEYERNICLPAFYRFPVELVFRDVVTNDVKP